MGKRLWRRLPRPNVQNKCGTIGRLEGDIDSFENMTGQIDPDSIFRIPLRRPPSDVALRVSIHALLLHERRKIRGDVLCKACKIKPRDLQSALQRAAGVTGSGKAKYFEFKIQKGMVSFKLKINRIVRPDTFVQLSISVLADAPTMYHVRVYALSAKVASGDHGRYKHIVRIPLNDIGLENSKSPDSDLATMIEIYRPFFKDRCFLASEVVDGVAYIQAWPNGWVYRYDYRYAPKPYMHPGDTWIDSYKEFQPYAIKDGARSDGLDLTISAIRTSRIIEWVSRELNYSGKYAPNPGQWQRRWLVLIERALFGEAVVIRELPIISQIITHGAAEIFEYFLLDELDNLVEDKELICPYFNDYISARAERMRLRRIIASSPAAEERLIVRWRPGVAKADGRDDLTEEEYNKEHIIPLRKYLVGRDDELNLTIELWSKRYRIPDRVWKW